MIKKLIKLANHLDKKGFIREADYLDAVIKEASDPDTEGEVISLDSFRKDDSPKYNRVYEIDGIWSNVANMHIMPSNLFDELKRSGEDFDVFLSKHQDMIQSTNLNTTIGLMDLE